jgi:hypothetical protein
MLLASLPLHLTSFAAKFAFRCVVTSLDPSSRC